MINRLRTDLLLRVILRVQLPSMWKCWRKRRGHAKRDRTHNCEWRWISSRCLQIRWCKDCSWSFRISTKTTRQNWYLTSYQSVNEEDNSSEGNSESTETPTPSCAPKLEVTSLTRQLLTLFCYASERPCGWNALHRSCNWTGAFKPTLATSNWRA